VRTIVSDIARQGATPLVVADGPRVLGVIQLKDIVKGGIKERFADLRRMGIKTVMITRRQSLTAAAIAAEAGVDDFLAQATPEMKLKLIRETQAGGRLVAMTGDGTNDAPALAQADVAVAMIRDSGGERGRESDRSGLESDQTDRDRRDRQAAFDDAWRADHVQHRQRRIEVFCHHPSSLRHDLSGVGQAEHHAPVHARKCHYVGGDLQCADHHSLDPLALAWRALPPVGCFRLLRDNLVIYGLVGWWCRHWHQADRPAADRRWTGLTLEDAMNAKQTSTLLEQLRPALVILALLTVLTGLLYPLAMTGLAQLISRTRRTAVLSLVMGKQSDRS